MAFYSTSITKLSICHFIFDLKKIKEQTYELDSPVSNPLKILGPHKVSKKNFRVKYKTHNLTRWIKIKLKKTNKVIRQNTIYQITIKNIRLPIYYGQKQNVRVHLFTLGDPNQNLEFICLPSVTRARIQSSFVYPRWPEPEYQNSFVYPRWPEPEYQKPLFFTDGTVRNYSLLS